MFCLELVHVQDLNRSKTLLEGPNVGRTVGLRSYDCCFLYFSIYSLVCTIYKTLTYYLTINNVPQDGDEGNYRMKASGYVQKSIPSNFLSIHKNTAQLGAQNTAVAYTMVLFG